MPREAPLQLVAPRVEQLLRVRREVQRGDRVFVQVDRVPLLRAQPVELFEEFIDPRASAVDEFERLLAPDGHVYRWREDDDENPYYGLLAHADRLVVTSDSIAMLSEAVGAGKPVYLFDLAGLPADATLKSRVYGAMMKLGPQRLSRDLGLFHRRYVEEGFGAWLGSEAASVPADPEAEIDATVSRVLGLLER